MYLREPVSLADDAAFPLLNVRRPPRHIQVVQGGKPRLYVRPCAHHCSGSYEDPYLSGAHFPEQGCFLDLRLVVLHERDL